MCTQLDKITFDCCLKLKRLSKSRNAIPAKSESSGVKLPKLDVPRFDGNVLNWSSFWEQFCISLHNQPNFSDSEKLVYLQQAIKESPAVKYSVIGLSRSSEHITMKL